MLNNLIVYSLTKGGGGGGGGGPLCPSPPPTHTPTARHRDRYEALFFLFAVLNAVSGALSDQCGVDVIQLAIDVQDVFAVILEGAATLTYTVFEKELGLHPPELGIVIPPSRNVS